MIRDAVLDRPLDAAAVGVLGLVAPAGRRVVGRRLAVEQHDIGAVRVQQLEVLERVAVDDEEIGDEAFAHFAEPIFHADQLRAVPRRVLDHLERLESGFLVQLEFPRDAEAVHRVDVPGIVSSRNQAALSPELAHRIHPDTVLLFPARLLRARPAEEVRSVVLDRAFEVLLHRRVEVVAEPRLVLRPHQVAAGLVDRERRIPRDVALHHPVDDLVQLRRVGLRVQLAGAPEAVDLVRVVHLRRERLDAGQRRVGDTVEMFDRVDAQVDVVVGGGLLDRDVRRGAKPERVGLVHDRFELIAIHADDLQAVGAFLLHLADPCTDLGGRSGATLADERIHQNPGRDDRVRVAFRLPFLRLLEIAADFTRRGHPGGEVQVALVLNRLRHAGLTLFVPVHVRVDDAGHHVLAGGVDHRVRCRRERG